MKRVRCVHVFLYMNQLQQHIIPLPTSVYSIGSAVFSVYRAKPLFSPRWEHPYLKDVVRRARKTYQRYGPVPVWDAYDTKAAVYVVQVSYGHPDNAGVPLAKGNIPLEEWLTVRFVPGGGEPLGLGTPELSDCRVGDIPLDAYLLALGHQALPRTADISGTSRSHRVRSLLDMAPFVAVSRLCALLPHRRSDRLPHSGAFVASKLRYTNMSFVLANLQFCEDTAERPFTHISGLFRPELVERRLTITSATQRVPYFAPAHTLWRKQHAERVVLNRTKLRTAMYAYPGYFLDTGELVTLLQSLIDEEQLSTTTISRYLSPGIAWDDVCAYDVPRPEQFAGLGELFLRQGKLPGAHITGAALRRRLDSEVRDGPRLYLMAMTRWKKSLEAFVRLYRENKYAHPLW